MKLSQIKPNPANPRVIKDHKFKQLVKSLQDFPEMMEKRPMVCVTDVDKKIFPLGGNMRYRAIVELGYKEIPDNWIMMADDWTEEKRREFVIKDNVSFGEWNHEELANEWDTQQLEEWGLDVPVFTDGNNKNQWNLKTDQVSEDGDGVIEKIGFNASSIWYGMARNVEGITDRLIELPHATNARHQGVTAIAVNAKYSRTIPEEIRRVVVTYMEEGDYFLENTCGWSTFGAIAALHGYKGIGVDIWDVALEYSRKQIKAVNGNVEILEMDGMNLTFADNHFDYVYCNPPFMDVELYSGKENDIASGDIVVFRANLERLCSENYRVLKKGKLCTMTISDTRKNGVLLSMANELMNAGFKAGFKLHDFVIAENLGIANILRKKAVEKKRCAKNHEYVITFIKK